MRGQRRGMSLQEHCIENHMEYLLTEWDYEKNGSLTPEDVTAGSNKKVWWRLSYDDEKTGRHFNFEWESQIYSRARGAGCPYLTGRKVWKRFNDLVTTYPELAVQWDYKKNGDLTPEDVTAGSNKKVWWRLLYDDKITGNYFNFEWFASIAGRVKNPGCPYLSGQAVWKGFNDLETVNPELAAEWDYKKNKLLPSEVTARSNRKVWWKCSICGHGWRAEIANRRMAGCPECAKELRTSFPEQAAAFYLEKHFQDAESGNWKGAGCVYPICSGSSGV